MLLDNKNIELKLYIHYTAICLQWLCTAYICISLLYGSRWNLPEYQSAFHYAFKLMGFWNEWIDVLPYTDIKKNAFNMVYSEWYNWLNINIIQHNTKLSGTLCQTPTNRCSYSYQSFLLFFGDLTVRQMYIASSILWFWQKNFRFVLPIGTAFNLNSKWSLVINLF